MNQKMSRFLRPLCQSLAALGITLAMGSSAFAQDLNFVPGTACNPNRADAGKINYSSQYGAYNEDTGTTVRTVYCPIVYLDTTNGDPHGIKVNVIDRNPSKDFSVTAMGMNEDGNVGFSSGPAKSTGASTTPQTLFFGFQDGLNFHIVATIPPAVGSTGTTYSRLLNYGLYITD